MRRSRSAHSDGIANEPKPEPRWGPRVPSLCTFHFALGLVADHGRERPHTRALSDKVEAIKIHDLVPRGHKVTHELLLRVVTSVDLRDSSELGVRTEDEVDGGGGPLELARGAIATLVHVLSRGGCLPLRAHVEQVHEE